LRTNQAEKMPREFSRNQRLGTQVLRTLSELLRFDVKDPRLSSVSLTSVEMTRDVSVASALQGLHRASGFLRGKLGSALKIRHVPELRFVHDDSVAHGIEISKLIDDANRTGR
jgi:ribosome-binding factor A